jgi:tetratricopeptide (TPR) repeat protein
MRLPNITVLLLLAVITPVIGPFRKEDRGMQATSVIVSLQSPDLTEADRLENLAAISFSKRDYKSAAELLRNALSLREKTLGPNHPDVASTLHSLANVYEKAGQHERSIPLYLRAISILKSASAQPDSGLSELVKDYFCAKSSYPSDQDKPDVETHELVRHEIRALVGFDDGSDFGLVLNDRALQLIVPPYPRGATATQTIYVYARIDESGKVISAKAICGDPLLRKASIEAALKTRFKPQLTNGKATEVTGVLIYNFVYQGR